MSSVTERLKDSQRSISICLLSESHIIASAAKDAAQALRDLLADKNQKRIAAKDDYWKPDYSVCPVWRDLLKQAECMLAEQPNLFPKNVELFQLDSMDAAKQYLVDGFDDDSVEFFIVDLSVESTSINPDVINEKIQNLLVESKKLGKAGKLSPHSVVLVVPPSVYKTPFLWAEGNRYVRVLQSSALDHRADFFRILLDHLDHAYSNRMLARTIVPSFEPVNIAVQIVHFMRANWGVRWDCHFFTGSMVSGLIQSMQILTQDSENRCLNGCNEHSLAVSALAAWQLYQRASVIIVTSGMVDEFRGTLFNLKRAQVPCLIVCADSPDSIWFPFQGTMDQDNDSRKVIQARGLDVVFIETPTQTADLLPLAFKKLVEKSQPVFILATQTSLEQRYTDKIPIYDAPPPFLTTEITHSKPDRNDENLEKSLNIINDENRQIIWFCGALSQKEKNLVIRIAEKAGIILVDGLLFPGSVPAYQHGKKVRNYFGTLAMYGFNRLVYRCLHDDQELKDSTRLSIFFLKSRIDQAATPFSEGKLKRQLHVVQVNKNSAHMAPFSDIAVAMKLENFLEKVEEKLNISPSILAGRNDFIEQLRHTEPTVPTDRIATFPMTANYFFHNLADVVIDLIETRNYDYVGVYDVGRCGVSAIRNIPRTRQGFSGWYGRALMGDALSALPYIALNSDTNILAFIGDGARALVPNMESWIVENFSRSHHFSKRNVTVFYLNNGVLSLIQTYLDKRYSFNGADQVRVKPIILPAAEEEIIGRIKVRRCSITVFDITDITHLLTTPGVVNFVDVSLSHNSEGDGISVISENAWNRRYDISINKENQQ